MLLARSLLCKQVQAQRQHSHRLCTRYLCAFILEQRPEHRLAAHQRRSANTLVTHQPLQISHTPWHQQPAGSLWAARRAEAGMDPARVARLYVVCASVAL